MSKAILVANRKGQDSQTNGDVLWITLYILPKLYTKTDGTTGMYYPKKEDALVTVCISKERKPDDFNKLKDVREGAICVPRYIVDDFTNKAKLSTLDVLPGTNKYTPDQLYKE